MWSWLPRGDCSELNFLFFCFLVGVQHSTDRLVIPPRCIIKMKSFSPTPACFSERNCLIRFSCHFYYTMLVCRHLLRGIDRESVPLCSSIRLYVVC